MKYEKEITVEVDLRIEELKKLLNEYNFKLMEEYDLNDIYMINKDIKKDNNYLDMLKHCVLIRHIIEQEKEKKLITYKYKEYNENGEIVKQGKTNCSINSVEEAKELLNNLNYEEIIEINDHMLIYSNNIDEIAVQCVNNKHIYIEIEDKCNYIDKEYQSEEEMKEVIKRYNIPIKNNDYFVKKAEIEMMESL